MTEKPCDVFGNNLSKTPVAWLVTMSWAMEFIISWFLSNFETHMIGIRQDWDCPSQHGAKQVLKLKCVKTKYHILSTMTFILKLAEYVYLKPFF
jgi:hypothetical protein